jgi:uncharacterized protein (TIGR03437 family)
VCLEELLKAKLCAAFVFLPIGLSIVPSTVIAQESRIVGQIDSAQTVTLSGNLNPRAQARYDIGPVDPAFKLNYVTLVLKPSAQQQMALDELLTEQQDRSSPNYHRWLTPEQYADRFGLSRGDVGKVKGWLEGQGFTVGYIARGRNWLTFGGTASQVTKAFRTEIHRYVVDGEIHYANPTEPSIPAALESTVQGLLGLDNFVLKSSERSFRASSKRPLSTPAYTGSSGVHVLVPDDIATIYDIARLYQASVDGTGQRVVVAGQSDISLADIATFREGILPVNVPQVVLVPGSADPGVTAAQDEADLDIEWIGAIARNAQIIYVNSTGVAYSAEYAISENIAPIISFSYTFGCEQALSTTALSTARSNIQQANAQGITLLVASGDSGAAGCDAPFASSEATQGSAVAVPASVPEVTAVGGSEFNDIGGNYWSNSNSATGASALSYIPETAWNESALEGELAASGGGLSMFYQQPPWQIGPGVPNVNARAVPDVALSAANDHDPYAIVTGGQAALYGGTSAATPVFAGIIALLNQYERSGGQGNINPNLYRLAQTNIFHDITTGSNVVPCVAATPNCVNGSFGYYAGIGYDLVTGLGSVDAYNLVTEWNAATPVSNVVPSSSPNSVNQQAPDANGYSWLFTLTLNERAGVGTSFTDFTINGTSYASQIVSFFGTNTIPAGGYISAPLGYKTLTVPTILVFGFSGVDAGGRHWSQQLSVPFNGMQSSPPPTISLSQTKLQFSFTVGGALPAPQSITVSNSGSGTLTWSASSNVSWLNLSTGTDTLTVSLNPTGLAPGNYNGSVSVTGSGASNSPQSIAVTLTVTAAVPSVVLSAVVNAASYQAGMSPGELATLFGKNLSPVVGIESPGGATSYKGVSVTVDGILAPLFTVANVNGQEQINFQVPAGLPGSGAVETVQVNNNGSIGTMNVASSSVQPGVFAYVPSGSSASYAVMVKPDGSVTGPSNPVARGSTVVMYATGLGPTSPALATGQPGPVPPANTTYVLAVEINGVDAPVLFSGVAPGFIGLNQVNFTIPGNAPVGSDLLLRVIANGVASPNTGIAVQ